MKYEPHFRIIAGQAFIAAVPMYIQNADGSRVPVAVATLTDIQCEVRVKNGGIITDYAQGRDTANSILLDFPSGIAEGVYSVTITAKLAGRVIKTAYMEAFEGVPYNRDTTYENFITGARVVLPDSVFVLSADTTAIAGLEQQLQAAIEAAQDAKAEYDRKAAMLDGMAQQGEDANATNTAIYNAVGNIDFSTLAKQGNNPDATNTAILAAFGSIDFSTLAKQGNNANISLTSMDDKLGNMVLMSENELAPALQDLDEMLNDLD